MLAREAWGLAQLVDLLVEAIVEHLAQQVAAGADAVQLFDSWAGLLTAGQAMEWCLAPTLRILAGFAACCPGVPVILVPRAVAPEVLEALAEDGRAAALSIATDVDPAWAREHLQSRVAVQGNLDPLVLVEGGAALEDGVARLRQALGDGPWICNLGHGVLPQTPPEHVARLVALVRG
jgi:uroporphyrinogen decarboxylase